MNPRNHPLHGPLTRPEPPDFTNDPRLLDELMDLPGAPAQHRFHQALQSLRGERHPDPATRHTALADQLELEAMLRTRNFHRDTVRRLGAMPKGQMTLDHICTAALAGATEDHIGMAVITAQPQVTFAQLTRTQPWMGVNPILPRVDGLTAVVFPDWRPRNPFHPRPAAVLAAPRKLLEAHALFQKPLLGDTFPQGQPQTLMQALADNGAIRSHWLLTPGHS